MTKSRRIIGIDPGYDRLGIAVIEGDPSRPMHVWSTCVEPAKGNPEARLARVFSEVQNAIETYKPDALGIETLFFSSNTKSALAVAEARGAVLAAAGNAKLPVFEFSPQHVKLAVTGYGAADKKAIAQMVPKLISLPAVKRRLDDELDAIAVAIAALSSRFPHS